MSTPPADRGERRRAVVIAGHRGDDATARTGLVDDDGAVRAAALGALSRMGRLTDDDVRTGLGDESPVVRRRACELAATRPHVSLLPALSDDDPTVVEVAAWACGEQADQADHADEADQADRFGRATDGVVDRLVELTTGADDPLVREAGAAALGAIGDPRGLPAILAACGDKPHVRRRAVLALAPFDGPDVEAAIERALTDRDWQVRQAAEDLRRAAGERPI